jgi:tetratricopeptide (TPR) repeat protein
VRALETAVFAMPDYGWAWGRLGKALRALGRHEEAVRAYEKSVAHGFAPPVLWSDLGESAAELRDLPRLRRACRELGRLDADLAKALRRKLRSLVSGERARGDGPAGSAPPARAGQP